MPTSRPLTIGYRGPVLLDLPLLNKGSAFTAQERHDLGLYGLIPEQVESIAEQVIRCYKQFEEQQGAMAKHVYLRNLQDTNETLFYRLLRDHLEEMMPIVYTPTVGAACQEFSSIYRRARGLFISWPQRDKITAMVNTVTKPNIKVIVITDGERILGLGDQGIGGMGIPIGKLSLYTACGGISPAYTLPVVVDTGTNNQTLLQDPMYMGWRNPRITDQQQYLEMMDTIIQGLLQRWPRALIQFEDFALDKANTLLARYQDNLCCFNDDIQGTAAVTLGALISAGKAAGKPIHRQKILFIGAGSAGCGIADQLLQYLIETHHLSMQQAQSQVIVCNRSGVLRQNNPDLRAFQRRVAQPPENYPELTSAQLIDLIRAIKPDALIGVSGTQGLFDRQAITHMADYCQRPIIFPLSNPTSKSEATASDLIKWTKGTAIVASGSPFAPVNHQGTTIPIAQCNNCYIFPGIGLGAIAIGATRITKGMMMAAAHALAQYPCQEILPPISEIMQVSRAVALAVATRGIEEQVATSNSTTEDLAAQIEQHFWIADYRHYKPAAHALA